MSTRPSRATPYRETGALTKVHIRPANPPTSDIPPDDLLCTWVVRGVARGNTGKPYWELKYIHTGCHQHASLPRAA